jgi:tetratricopeptide (TPR) repeat protein
MTLLRLLPLVLVAVLAPVRASAADAVIPAGQERAVAFAVTQVFLPGGATYTDIRIEPHAIAIGVRKGAVDSVVRATWRGGAWHVAAPEPCVLDGSGAEEQPCRWLERMLGRQLLMAGVRVERPAPDDLETANWAARLQAADTRLAVAQPEEARREVLEAAAALWPPKPGANPALAADVALLLAKVGASGEAARWAGWLARELPQDATSTPSPPASLEPAAWSRVAAVLALQPDTRAAGGESLDRCFARHGSACDPIPLADALELAGDPSAAAALLDRHLAAPHATPALYRARIGLASRRDDAAAETRVAEAAVARFPDDLGLQDALGTARFRAGRHEDAIAVFEALHRRDPARKDVLGKLAGVLGDLGRVDDEAAKAGRPSPGAFQRVRAGFQQRAASDPGDTVAQFVAAVSVFYDGRFEEALRLLAAVEAKVPNEGRVHIYTGMAHLWLGREEQAARAIQRAMEVNPHDPDVYYCQSQVLRLHDLPAAAKALERYVALAASPGALQFPHKTARVRQELAMLRAGQLPPLWDKPGHFAQAESADNPWLRLRMLGWLGLGLIVAGVAFAGWRRSRRLSGGNRPP